VVAKKVEEGVRDNATIVAELREVNAMASRLKDLKELKIERPPRVKLSAKESLKRTKEFDKRKERFIAAVRTSQS
jgi:hypothetical protein